MMTYNGLYKNKDLFWLWLTNGSYLPSCPQGLGSLCFIQFASRSDQLAVGEQQRWWRAPNHPCACFGGGYGSRRGAFGTGCCCWAARQELRLSRCCLFPG